jgi:hypothetical protein
LNAIGAAHAANDFMLYMTGLISRSANLGFLRHMALTRATWLDEPRRDDSCPECGNTIRSRRGRGSARSLTLKTR